uniref:hypothetical protein n=1 Tax=uncultured Microscilla sp. TaxID=432653 RepID=UPI0026030167
KGDIDVSQAQYATFSFFYQNRRVEYNQGFCLHKKNSKNQKPPELIVKQVACRGEEQKLIIAQRNEKVVYGLCL